MGKNQPMIRHYLAAREELAAEGSPFATAYTEVRGSQLKAYVNAPPHMRAIWESTVQHAQKDYVVYEDERYTYGDIHVQVRKLAAHLVAHGVTRGTRVGLAMRNYPEWVVSYWATVSLGAALVGMNAWWTAPEMEYALNDSQPVVLIADDERLERLQQIANAQPMHIVTVRSSRVIGSDCITWDRVMAAADPGALPVADIDPDDDATIFYTSGTTGFPKGAQLTHRGSVNNILNLAAMSTTTARSW